jgi:TPR repeat protein
LRNTKAMYLFYLFGFVCFATGAIADESPITSKTEYDQAIAYENGVGVSQDSCKAFDLFLQCAKRGDPRAKYKVGLAYFNGVGVAKDQVEGLAWMHNAVRSGISGAVRASMEEAIGAEMSVKARKRAGELGSGSTAPIGASNGKAKSSSFEDSLASLKASIKSDKSAGQRVIYDDSLWIQETMGRLGIKPSVNPSTRPLLQGREWRH